MRERRIVYGIALAVVAVICGLSPEAAAAQQRDGLSLRIMTYNVRYPARGDTGNRWVEDGRRMRAYALLREHAPDIIGMQEAYRSQLGDFLANVPGYACVGKERYGATDEEHAAILVRADRFMVEACGTFWLSPTPDVPGSRGWWPTGHPRVATWARIIHLPTARRLLVVSTHFPTGEAPDSIKALAAGVIRERIGAQGDLPVILVGDFNSRPESLAYGVLTGAGGLRDAWEIARERSGPSSTSHGFRGTPRREGRRIDWILVSPGIAVAKVETVTFAVDGKFPSDHFPVVADIVVGGE